MAGTAAVVGAIGSLAGAGAMIYSGQQQKKDREDEEDRLEKQKARDVDIHKDKTRRLLGAQKAAYAASGVRVGQDTPLAAYYTTKREAEEEREAIKKGYGFRSDVLQTAAKRHGLYGWASGAGTLLKGIGDYSSSPYARNPFATR